MQQLDLTTRMKEYLYKVRLPYLRSRTEAEMRLYGTTLSGVKAIDNDIINQDMTTWISISDMLEYYKKGVEIKITAVVDTKSIYDTISEYINYWKVKLERGVNLGSAPIEDLIALDEFANLVYDHAKYQFTREVAQSFMARQLTSNQFVNASNLFNNRAFNMNAPRGESGVTVLNPESPSEIEDRESLGSFFKARLSGLRRYGDV